jgi:hypothetical protein
MFLSDTKIYATRSCFAAKFYLLPENVSDFRDNTEAILCPKLFFISGFF